MRDINQKPSDTDKRITTVLQRSIWLSYLLSLGAISAGGLSVFSAGVILGTKPAQANMKEPAASLPTQTVAEQALSNSSSSSEPSCPAGFHQALANGNPSQTAEEDLRTTTNITRSRQAFDKLNLKVSDTVALGSPPATTSETLTSKADAPNIVTAAPSALQDSCRKDDAQPGLSQAQPEAVVLGSSQPFIAQSPAFIPTNLERATEFKFASLISEPPQLETAALNTAFPANSLSSVSVGTTTDSSNLSAQRPAVDKPTTVLPTIAPSSTEKTPELNLVERKVPEPLAVGNQPNPEKLAQVPSATKDEPVLNSVERKVPEPLAVGNAPTALKLAQASAPTDASPTVHKGTGGASLLGDNIQAQTSVESKPQVLPPSENSSQLTDPLAPTLRFQGAYIYQDDSSARARLTGTYPISPNAIFGATVDLTTGDSFSDSPGGGLQLNELYFTGSLPSLPNLRMTVGLIDLTSYFDRNSFAKDAVTHFFNPVFQTNPALAATGISSRPGVLLNWDITDNLQARAAAFSSHRNLGDFAIDGFAGELAYRAGNAIIRGTFASDRDAGRDNGFKEIYDLPRGNGERGLLSGDRENSYGINAEYFIPQLKMGLFGRYGHYDNTSLGKGGDTYSLGLNFLDLFMKDDRLGFGYGRDLSNNSLRRDVGNKVPDVWELFYDFRLLPNLRAGVTLQARDEFSDVTAGFRVKTELDLLGRLFR